MTLVNSRPLAPQLRLLCLSGPSSSVYPAFLFLAQLLPLLATKVQQTWMRTLAWSIHRLEQWGPSVTPFQTTRREAQEAWPCLSPGPLGRRPISFRSNRGERRLHWWRFGSHVPRGDSGLLSGQPCSLEHRSSALWASAFLSVKW